MTTQTPDEALDAAETPTDAPDAAIGPEEPAQPHDDSAGDPAAEPEGGNREAAKYRTQLRATEAARDQLSALLTAQRDALLSGYVDARLVAAAGADPADAVDPETGLFDPARAQQLAARVHAEVGVTPGIKERPAMSDLKSGAAVSPSKDKAGWAGLLGADADRE